jgi:alpha-amylase
MLSRIPYLFVAVLAISLPSHGLVKPDLRHRSIYQVLTDRFARSDGALAPCELGAKQYCGGDWKGIEQRIDYIQGMGFDTGER